MSATINMDHKLDNIVDEAYKVLSTNIIHGVDLDEIRMVCVTSFSPGDGKTTTSENLAISLAKSGHKVLLIDADMRTVSDDKRFTQAITKNLSQYHLGNCRMQEIILKTNVPNLNFVSIGLTDNPIGICTDKKFEDFLRLMKNDYDYVIFDTPAMGTYVDAAIIAAKCDGTLIVAKADDTHNEHILRVKAQLEKLNAKIIGVVLNKVSESDYKHYYLVDESKKDKKKSWLMKRSNR